MNSTDPRITVSMIAITTLIEQLRAANLISLPDFLGQLSQAQVACAMTGRAEDSRCMGEFIQTLRDGCGNAPA